jgi:hypothetical protein
MGAKRKTHAADAWADVCWRALFEGDSEQELAGRDQADTAGVTLRQKAQQRQQAVWAINGYMLARK